MIVSKPDAKALRMQARWRMTDREPWIPPAITTVEKPGADTPAPPTEEES